MTTDRTGARRKGRLAKVREAVRDIAGALNVLAASGCDEYTLLCARNATRLLARLAREGTGR